jgi:hypothetical protein
MYVSSESGTWLRGPDDCAAFVSNRLRSIFVARSDQGVEEAFQHALTHLFIPCALALWGELVFHCACVSINGSNLLIGGSSFSGKSSISAGLQARGHRVFSDDITRITLCESSFRAHPSYPTIRLRTGSVTLPEIIDALPLSEPVSGRRYWSTTSPRDVGKAMRVSGFIDLSRGRGRARFTALDNVQKVQTLLANVFLTGVESSAMIACQFPLVIDAAPKIKAARLTFRHSAAEFPLVLDAIESFAQSLQDAQKTLNL